jgi:hypothetical protein
MMILRLRRFAAALAVWALSTFSALTVLTPASLAQTIPGKFYEYRILSIIGQTPLNAGQPLTSTPARPKSRWLFRHRAKQHR